MQIVTTDSYSDSNHEYFCDVNWCNLNLTNSCFTGIKKKDAFAEPICSSHCWQLDYLREAAGFVKQWHAKAPTMSLTPQTTLANELTFVGMANLATYLIENKGMSKVLLGKFSSDPIEKRFGQFRQLSGANFFISVRQLLDAEKRIRILSLIRDGKIGYIDIDNRLDDDMVSENATMDLKLEPISELHMSEVDRAKLYYVAGYAGM